IARDVTATKEGASALRESEARKAAVLNVALDAIVTIDAQGRVLEFNPAAEEMFGYSGTEAAGQPIAELIIPPELRDRHYRCLEAWHRCEVNVPRFEAITRQHTFARGVGLPGRVWTSGKPVWIPDVAKDANFPRAPVAAQEGLHGAFGCPIMLGREVLGVMEF